MSLEQKQFERSNGGQGAQCGSVCPHFLCPQVIVTQPGSRRGNVKGEHLLLRAVNRFVVNDQFGLRDTSRREEAATSWEVLALTALSPAGREVAASSNSTLHHTSRQLTHMLYLFRVTVRQLVALSVSGRMTVALTLMNISKVRASSTSPNSQGTMSAMKPGGADTPG